MKITIPQPNFLKHLQLVEHAVNERSALPILANVLLQTRANGLTLTTTDLDVGIRCDVELEAIVEEGAVTLPARKLATIIRELPDEPVTLEAKKNHTALLSCGSSRFRIPGLPVEDFPILPEQGAAIAAISQALLKGLLMKTSYAASTEETRFVLNGTLVDIRGETLTIVSTDGRRLAVASATLTTPTTTNTRVILPAKTVRELERLLQDEEGEEATLSPLQDNQLIFRFGTVSLVTRLIDGQFPEYEKVIPAPSKQHLSCQRIALLNAIRRASLMTTASSQAVVFELEAARVVVSKESPEQGSAREEVPATYTGEPATVAFNPQFWIDALKALDGDEVTIEVFGPDRPAVIRSPDFTYLVLPMKLS